MRPALIFVESNSTGTGRLMARAAAQLGFRPLVLASAPERYAYLEQDRLAARTVDTQDEEQVLAACRALAADGGVAGVTSSSEYFVGMAAAVAERLGLPAPSAAAIRACTDKATQRRLLTEGRVPVPAWRSAVSVSEAVAAAGELGWPVVLKPVAGSGSIGVKLCRDPREVAEHAALLVTRTTNERGIAVPPVLLVESLVEGPEYSVEVFSSRIVGITAKRLGPLPHFVEIGHDFPADLTGDARAAIEAATLAALRALRLEVGPAHVELRLGPDGPALIEVNARLAGGFIPELVRLARGVDLLETNVRFAAGLPIALDATRDNHVAIRFLLPDGDGLLAEVRGLEAAARVPLVVEAAGYRALGEPVSRRGDFRDRIGHVIACGADRAAVLEAADVAARQVSMHVTPVEGSDPQQRPRATPVKELARVESTGRIRKTLDSELARIVFGADADAAIDAELPFMTEVDRAHVVMLAEAGLMTPDVAARLLGEIEALRREEFASLRGRPAPRGLYLLYESHLVAQLGPEVGGALHTG
ncbi:MAG: ATP-grasp domain-containing protein, partial [Kofleriaceae bacterium]